jgi:transposase
MRRFRYRKVTPQIKRKIVELHEQGKTYKEIAEKFGFSVSTVNYHLNPKVRENAIKRTKRNPNYGKKLYFDPEYMKKYMVERYALDIEFRERVKKHAITSFLKRNIG